MKLTRWSPFLTVNLVRSMRAAASWLGSFLLPVSAEADVACPRISSAAAIRPRIVRRMLQASNVAVAKGKTRCRGKGCNARSSSRADLGRLALAPVGPIRQLRRWCIQTSKRRGVPSSRAWQRGILGRGSSFESATIRPFRAGSASCEDRRASVIGRSCESGIGRDSNRDHVCDVRSARAQRSSAWPASRARHTGHCRGVRRQESSKPSAPIARPDVARTSRTSEAGPMYDLPATRLFERVGGVPCPTTRSPDCVPLVLANLFAVVTRGSRGVD